MTISAFIYTIQFTKYPCTKKVYRLYLQVVVLIVKCIEILVFFLWLCKDHANRAKMYIAGWEIGHLFRFSQATEFPMVFPTKSTLRKKGTAAHPVQMENCFPFSLDIYSFYLFWLNKIWRFNALPLLYLRMYRKEKGWCDFIPLNFIDYT
jgi:hypothetical protein